MNILFVCTGNTCRSPMAAAIAKHLARGRTDIEVRSAGTGAAVGQGMTSQSRAALKNMGVEVGQHTARQFTPELCEWADLILCMEKRHMQSVTAICPRANGKTYTLGSYSGIGFEISDPFGQSDAVYTKTALDIKNAVEKMLENL